jgi:hypothetical protein
MKRSGFLKRKTPLKAKGKSDTALIKDHIQALLRRIVSLRDGGFILRNVAGRGGIPDCNGYTKAGQVILQADHLITRGTSVTFTDPRLVVCLCQGHHGWRSLGGNVRKALYDELVKSIIESERVALWEACERESWRPHRAYAADWRKEAAYLQTKVNAMTDTEHE